MRYLPLLLPVLLSYICLNFAKHSPLAPTFGVPKSIHHQYDKKLEDFLCLDGTKSIPFSSVNDNFCDCQDGTDEPGTAACPNGQFHCINAGHRPANIPSSRVNDGLCDCCDGTDEYEIKDISCPNTCIEMYRDEKQKTKEREVLHLQGFESKKQFIESAKKYKADKVKELEELKIESETIGAEVDILEKKKNEAEELSNAEKQKHDELVEQQKAEIKAAKIRSTFETLDANKDGNISLEEIEFEFPGDRDKNEVMDHTQCAQVLGNMEHSLQFEDFKEKYGEYNTFKKYLAKQEREKEQMEFEEPPMTTEDQKVEDGIVNFDEITKNAKPKVPESQDVKDNEDDDDQKEFSSDNNDNDLREISSDKTDDDDDDDEDDDDSEGEGDSKTLIEDSGSDSDDVITLDYDENTKRLFQEAEEAKSAYESKKSSLDNAQDRLKDVENFFQMDLGEADEFYPLMNNCFDYTDKEYTYTVCPFNKCTQKQLNGGRETSLGSWGQWDHKAKRYGAMLMRNGEKCWNGPDRTSLVRFTCGGSNKLVSVDEPSRCEYSFEFQTPAMCQNISPGHSHEEL